MTSTITALSLRRALDPDAVHRHLFGQADAPAAEHHRAGNGPHIEAGRGPVGDPRMTEAMTQPRPVPRLPDGRSP